MSLDTGIRLAYLIAAVCFIVALSGLSGPKTARAGNLVGAAGMLIAIGMTFATPSLGRFGLMALAMVIGAAIGFPAARLVKMTAIPQMVAAFNGVGGGAAALIALDTFIASRPKILEILPVLHGATFTTSGGSTLAVYQVVEVLFGVIVGCVSFAGAAIAFAKLQELVTGRGVSAEVQKSAEASLECGGTRGWIEHRLTPLQLLESLHEHGVVDRVLRCEVRIQRGWLHADCRSQLTKRHVRESPIARERPSGLDELRTGCLMPFGSPIPVRVS